MPELKATPDWLRANVATADPTVGVDRENRTIKGGIMALEGDFKTPGRGSFDEKSLRAIVKLAKQEGAGLKSRLAHATLSDDGVSKYLGRWQSPRMSTAKVKRNGEDLEVMAVRGDLKLSDTAFDGNPNGNIGQYVLDLAAEDPGALSSSLVLQVTEETRLDNRGHPLKDEAGEPLPPLWRPTALHGSDVVAMGDAVDALLSVDMNALPDAVVRQGTALLDRQFAGQPREVVESRCLSWLIRYLDVRYGEKPPVELPPMNAVRDIVADAMANDLDKKILEGKAQTLAAIGGVAPGDRVQFIQPDEDELYACTISGVVRATRSDGPLQIPGTDLELTGTIDNPAALVQCWDVDDDEPDLAWYLVGFDRLTKLIIPSEDPGSASRGSMISKQADLPEVPKEPVAEVAAVVVLAPEDKEEAEFAESVKQRGEEIAAAQVKQDAEFADNEAFALELEVRKRQLQGVS